MAGTASMCFPNIILKSAFRRPGCLNICHLNVGSVFPKIDIIRNIFESINVHIIVISETWFKSYHSNVAVGIEGFNVVRNDRMRRRSGGVAVYVRDSIKLKVICTSNNIGTEYLFMELILPIRRFYLEPFTRLRQ